MPKLKCNICHKPITVTFKGEAICFYHYNQRFKAEEWVRQTTTPPPQWWVGRRGSRYADEPL